jgi:hypothetical protein
MAARKPAKAQVGQPIKTTIYISPEGKRRLTYAKADMRAKGLPTSESKIVDALVCHIDPEQLAKWLK